MLLFAPHWLAPHQHGSTRTGDKLHQCPKGLGIYMALGQSESNRRNFLDCQGHRRGDFVGSRGWVVHPQTTPGSVHGGIYLGVHEAPGDVGRLVPRGIQSSQCPPRGIAGPDGNTSAATGSKYSLPRACWSGEDILGLSRCPGPPSRATPISHPHQM